MNFLQVPAKNSDTHCEVMTNEPASHANGTNPVPAAVLCRDCGQVLPSGAAQGFCPHCIFREMGAASGDDPAVPLRNMGSYELLEVIGRGGMGTVYRAQHTRTGAERALKMISAGELASPTARRRFLQEAGAAAALQHPGIVTIHEAGAQDGMPFFVMDYVPGRTLADAVKEKPMPPHAAAACMAKVAGAIQHAHESGVMHRDLKPSNILLDHLGEPRVADFGLARHVNSESSLTGSQQILGSPAYMSPEQAAGGTKNVTATNDVYALGAVLYHLLTGRPPFQGDSPQAVLRQVSDDEPVPPRRILPTIPRDLETISLKCMEKNPARRYGSAAALAQDLQHFLHGEPILARPVSMAGRWLRRARRNPALTAMGAVLVAGAIIGLSFIIHKNRELSRSDAAKTTALTEKEATLAESLLWQAEFQRTTGRLGQREGSLEALRAALKLPLTTEQRRRARNAAIAALALPDAKFRPRPDLPVPATPALAMTDRLAKRYACVTADGRLTITDLKTNAVITTHDPAPHRIDALLNWSQDGLVLAYRYDGTRLGILHPKFGPTFWDEQVWPSPEAALPNQVVFQPIRDNALIRPWYVIHPDREGSLLIREAWTGFIRHRLPPPPGPLPEWRALGYSLARNLLAAACGSRPEIVIWNMDASPPVIERTLQCRAIVQSLDWENIENWLLAGDVTGSLTAWDVRTGEAQPPFEGHTQPVFSTVSGPADNFRYLSSAADGTLRMWDRGALRPILTMPGTSTRLCLDGPEWRVGPVTYDGQTGWYDLRWPSGFAWLSPPANSDGVRAITWHPDGQLFASLTGNSVVIFLRANGSSNTLVIPANHPEALRFTPNGRWLASADADGLHLSGIQRRTKGQEAALIRAGTDRVLLEGTCHDVCFDSTGTRMATVRHHGMLEVREMNPKTDEAGTVRHTFAVTPATRCALSSDGRWLAAGSPGNSDATVWDLNSGTIASEPAAVRTARSWLPAFSPDNKWLAWSGRTTLVQSPDNWAGVQTIAAPPNESSGRGAVFIPSAADKTLWLAVAAADQEVHLFRADTPFTNLLILRPPTGTPIGAMSVSRLGSLVCAVPKGEVHLWDLVGLRRETTKLGLGWEDR